MYDFNIGEIVRYKKTSNVCIITDIQYNGTYRESDKLSIKVLSSEEPIMIGLTFDIYARYFEKIIPAESLAPPGIPHD